LPKRISKRPKDSDQIAAEVAAPSASHESLIDQSTLSRVMAEMGRKGGKIGGRRRLPTLSPARSDAIAKGPADARWKKTKH